MVEGAVDGEVRSWHSAGGHEQQVNILIILVMDRVVHQPR